MTKCCEVLVCRDCNTPFLYSIKEQENIAKRGYTAPLRCRKCRMIRNNQRRQMKAEQQAALQKEIDDAKWKKKQAAFETELQCWDVTAIDVININDEETLYIIGNGFDRMHGANSSYYCFRDSMGRTNQVRRTLELYFDTPDLWWNLEEALACFNLDMMCNSYNMHDLLSLMDAYDEDAGSAEYFIAIEESVEPLRIISEELPK